MQHNITRDAVKKKFNEPIAMRFGDTEFIKTGTSRYDLSDPYSIAVTVSWKQFFILLILTELSLNSVFATLYTISPGCIANARPGSFVDSFFFSIETLATVGYGAMAPATLYGHIVSASEIVCGLIFTAIVTGLIFVRFSKPRPNILFAEKAVVTQHNGKPTLMIRIANGRQSVLAGASAQLTLLKASVSAEGRTTRQALELPLTRGMMPLFLLTWTLMHEIDQDSPLYSGDLKSILNEETVLILSVFAKDHSAGSDVFDIRFYDSSRILLGMAYQDAVSRDEQGRPHADLAKLSLVEPENTTSISSETIQA
jgi:inward rectifier potassium channel